MTPVRTYCDEGRSGLRLQGREALQRLIRDIQRRHPGFEAVLVLDVRRWGRFQNADGSAYCEFLCLRHGVRLLYVAEPFQSDGTPLSAVLKGLNRSMAAEYSRELSEKVYAGQCRVAKAGFHMAGPPGYGLRRMRLDAKGHPMGILEAGEHKALTSDHVKVVLGPIDEVRLVRWMFRQSAAGVESDAITRKHQPSPQHLCGHPDRASLPSPLWQLARRLTDDRLRPRPRPYVRRFARASASLTYEPGPLPHRPAHRGRLNGRARRLGASGGRRMDAGGFVCCSPADTTATCVGRYDRDATRQIS